MNSQKLANAVVMSIVFVALVFGLFTFFNVTPDIEKWSNESRFMCAICMAMFGALGPFIAFAP